MPLGRFRASFEKMLLIVVRSTAHVHRQHRRSPKPGRPPPRPLNTAAPRPRVFMAAMGITQRTHECGAPSLPNPCKAPAEHIKISPCPPSLHSSPPPLPPLPPPPSPSSCSSPPCLSSPLAHFPLPSPIPPPAPPPPLPPLLLPNSFSLSYSSSSS